MKNGKAHIPIHNVHIDSVTKSQRSVKSRLVAGEDHVCVDWNVDRRLSGAPPTTGTATDPAPPAPTIARRKRRHAGLVRIAYVVHAARDDSPFFRTQENLVHACISQCCDAANVRASSRRF